MGRNKFAELREIEEKIEVFQAEKAVLSNELSYTVHTSPDYKNLIIKPVKSQFPDHVHALDFRSYGQIELGEISKLIKYLEQFVKEEHCNDSAKI